MSEDAPEDQETGYSLAKHEFGTLVANWWLKLEQKVDANAAKTDRLTKRVETAVKNQSDEMDKIKWDTGELFRTMSTHNERIFAETKAEIEDLKRRCQFLEAETVRQELVINTTSDRCRKLEARVQRTEGQVTGLQKNFDYVMWSGGFRAMGPGGRSGDISGDARELRNGHGQPKRGAIGAVEFRKGFVYKFSMKVTAENWRLGDSAKIDAAIALVRENSTEESEGAYHFLSDTANGVAFRTCGDDFPILRSGDTISLVVNLRGSPGVATIARGNDVLWTQEVPQADTLVPIFTIDGMGGLKFVRCPLTVPVYASLDGAM